MASDLDFSKKVLYSASNDGKTKFLPFAVLDFENLVPCHLEPVKNHPKKLQKNRDHLLLSSLGPKLYETAIKSKWTAQSHEITKPGPLLL